MKELTELTEKATGALIRVLDYIEKGEVFVIEHAPIVIQELLLWKYWWSMSVTCLFGVVLLMAVVATVMASRAVFDCAGDQVAIVLVLAVVACICAVVIVANADWLKITLAPNLFVLDYVRGLR